MRQKEIKGTSFVLCSTTGGDEEQVLLRSFLLYITKMRKKGNKVIGMCKKPCTLEDGEKKGILAFFLQKLDVIKC